MMITIVRLRCVHGLSGAYMREVWERVISGPLPACESMTFKQGTEPARLIASSLDLPCNTIRLTYRFCAPNRAAAETIAEHLRSLGFSQVIT